MALFKVTAQRAQFDLSDNNSTDVYGAGIRFDQNGFARANTSAGTFFNQGIPMSASGQVSIVDATAGLPSGTIFHNGLPISGEKVCVSRNATSVVSSGLPFDSNGALAADLNFDLNFVNATTLDSNITFTRASSATYFDSAGVLQTATTDTPRFDYNPATLASRGLLIEEQRTNSLLYSSDLTQTEWNKTLGTVTVTVSADATTSPDGTVNADKVITANATGDHIIGQVSSVTSGTSYTQTWFLKAAELNWVQVTESTGFGSTQFQNINLSNGAVGNGNYGSAVTVTSIGNGWYRVSVTDTATATSVSGRFLLALLTSNVSTRLDDVTGDGVSGVYVWGAQLEAGGFATSYIPTTTAAATRNADVASVNTLSPWYSATEGTLFAEGTVVNNISGTTARIYAELGISAGTERIIVEARSSTSTRARTVTGGTTVISSVTYNALGVNTKVAAAYGSDGITAAVVGLAPVTTASGIPVVDTLFIGRSPNAVAAAQLNGHLRRITYYPRRLTNAELQNITLPTGATITTQDYSLDTNFVGNTVAIGS